MTGCFPSSVVFYRPALKVSKGYTGNDFFFYRAVVEVGLGA